MSRSPTHPSQEQKEESEENKNRPSVYPVGSSGTVDVGLDTITFRVVNGNLKIVEEMEAFIIYLQKKYIGVSSYPVK